MLTNRKVITVFFLALVAFMMSGSIETTTVYASHHSGKSSSSSSSSSKSNPSSSSSSSSPSSSPSSGGTPFTPGSPDDPVLKLKNELDSLHSVTITATHHGHGSSSSGTSSSNSGLLQIPSNHADFPGNDVNAIQVHVIGAKKVIVGAYHVTGEVTNVGNQTLNSVQVTAHLYNVAGNLVGDALGFASPSNVDPGHTATFDSQVTSDQINGNPVSYRLSFDWS